jgi:NAD(P)-dependent dehydrogenase (short-subunit alcohol dehydrogenase family)
MPSGRTIVITGTASGIGRALALGFLADGAKVVAADLRPSSEVAEAGGLTREVDVADAAQVFELVDFAREQTGRLDVLISNAGYGTRGRIEDLEEGAFEKLVSVHLFGAVHGLRAAIPAMREQGYGRVIHTLSRAAELHTPLGAPYAAAKAALWSLTKAAAAENRDVDILVNGLIPGPTNTGIWGRDMPRMQGPEVVYPTARVLATLPAGGPSGEVFWNEKPYPLMDPANPRPGPGSAGG